MAADGCTLRTVGLGGLTEFPLDVVWPLPTEWPLLAPMKGAEETRQGGYKCLSQPTESTLENVTSSKF